MSSIRNTPTLKLASARLEFSNDRRFARILHALAVAALVILVVLLGRRFHADGQVSGAELADLRQQNSALRADLARARVELEMEGATRAALARQVAELNKETSELNSRLDFFNAQSGRPGKSH